MEEERTIDSHLDTYFAEFISNEQFRDSLIRTVMEVAFNAGNYYNADYLHKILAPMQLADRMLCGYLHYIVFIVVRME